MQRPERYGRIRERHMYESSTAQAREPREAFDPPVLRIESRRADCRHAALWPRLSFHVTIATPIPLPREEQ